jgi:hypothetical protein
MSLADVTAPRQRVLPCMRPDTGLVLVGHLTHLLRTHGFANETLWNLFSIAERLGRESDKAAIGYRGVALNDRELLALAGRRQKISLWVAALCMCKLRESNYSAFSLRSEA